MERDNGALQLNPGGESTELDERALPLTRGQLDIWLAQETGQLGYGVALRPIRENRRAGRT